jgi:Fe-S oxidoreductase
MKKYRFTSKFYLIIFTSLLLTFCFYIIAHGETEKQVKIEALQNSNNYIVEYVTSGATLWGICQRNLPAGVDIRDYIQIVRQYNNISNNEYIQPKQALKLPQ